MTYYDNNDSYNMSEYNRDSRFRSIAMNAVREAVTAFGRDPYPYTDNDAAIMDNIFLQLRSLGDELSVNRQHEHQPLSYAKTPPDHTQAQIAAALDSIDNLVRKENVPLAKAKTPEDKT